jgi:hypothetical protein
MPQNRHGPLKAVLENWPEYHENFKRVNPKLGHLTIKCLHLFHGLMQNRQYETRYNNFLKHGFEAWTTGITYNKDGLTEFSDPKQRSALLEFFKSRNEDIPLKEALGVVIKDTRKTKTPPLKNLNQNTPKPVLE